jgi:glutamyl-tRNA reductase
MSVWALGINHNTAPLDVRGRFAFALDQLSPTLTGLRTALQTKNGIQSSLDQPELTLVSTCNRTEIYGASNTVQSHDALQWLAASGGLSAQALQGHTYSLYEDQAARHAFRVASGLDSMVLGEPQILGQMKDAVRAAEDAGAMGSTLQQLFQRSFAVAKDVRTHTEIGAHSISMAAASVRLCSQLFEDLSEISVLFVGAGEMIELAATHFAAKNPTRIVIANRTIERGELLATKFANAQTMHLSELPSRLHEFDAVISCTASTLPIIGLGAVERAVKARKHRPIFMVDLAVPRDIEPEVKNLEDVYLYTVDDLATVVQTAQASRQAAVVQAEAIVDAGVVDFMHWMGQRTLGGSVPLIQQLNAQTDEWRALEIARAKKLLAKGENIDAVLEALSRGLTQKMLHGTYSQLNAADEAQREGAKAAASRLFLSQSQSKNGL